MQPTGSGLGQMPRLRRFDEVDTAAPPAKKSCLRQVEESEVAEKSLPSSCKHGCFDATETIFKHSMDLLKARRTRVVPGENYSKIIKSLSSFKDLISSELLRFTQNGGNPAADGQGAMYSPESPASERASTPTSPGTESFTTPGIKSSTEGVVHGTGVIATRSFKKDEEVCHYDGPLVYRIRNCHTGKYHVFTMKDMGNQIDFPENDSYVAWSGAFIAKSGRPAIEIGRDGKKDIRFLNHSKEPNVMIRCSGSDTVEWGNQDSIQLVVVAISDIKPGEELLFDYDKNKQDSEIDFSKSDVEIATEKQKNKIINRVKNLNQKGLHTEEKRSARTMQKEIILPSELDDEIGEILETLREVRRANCAPATLDDINKELDDSQKRLLNIIFSDNPSVLKDLASHLFPGKTGPKKQAFMKKLTIENIEQLKTYLSRSIFNGSQTWFKVPELKRHISSYR
ncbi:SET domain-containing protein [Endozoicomonas sp. ONNA1]|uniref:SET domain-containing protein n=2 Tax=unclassified Endozoicomonas TaxID=2644528 RepID=UPI002148B182|nr:SET domain-containing protein [Endozoicomonas sp. ONNA1]